VNVQSDATPTERGLVGRVALVTGAAKGLGRAISERLAADGAHCVLAARDVDALLDHARLLDEKYPQGAHVAVRCDVTSEADVNGMVETTVDRFEHVDIVVNAAGITGPIETPAERVTPEEFREVIDVNLLGTFLVCRAAIPHVSRGGAGRIVNIAGTSGLRGYRNRVAYSSSKWAVRGLTRTLALELGEHGITVNDVCPNVTHGSRMDRIVREKARVKGLEPDEIYRDFVRQTALGRFIEEADVAAAVSFLVSDGARNITGHDMVVDAGWDV
jgi:NAD(P)-dependent dehydrogenase (short-subunit alcohol dehydrogenase family)